VKARLVKYIEDAFELLFWKLNNYSVIPLQILILFSKLIFYILNYGSIRGDLKYR